MLDLWIVQDVDFTIAVGEAVRPYGVTWLEDCVYPDAWPDYRAVRDRLPGTTLAAGEKWYTAHPFRHAADLGLVDVLQPDIEWVGGLTPATPAWSLMNAYRGMPGMSLPVDGRVVPSDAPGFGIELTLDDIEAAT